MKAQIEVATHTRAEMIDVTQNLTALVKQSRIQEGFCYIWNPHTTAALTVNENADPDVTRDILAGLERFVPRNGDYRHAEGNSAAHIKASLFGPSLQIMIEDARLVLGTWQGVYFCEFDGPRRRRLQVRIVPLPE
ncbi:MAG: secondary thiamine-phosphate synthase enzyme YjbQ [Spirochaetota bacterium]|nr:secondary thiamine-phosphate synthase enzyme YjbQ [Spirochaetota bacterium]